MNIAIDARDILRRQTGIVTYTVNLVKGLARLDTMNQYTLYLDSYRDDQVGETNVVRQDNFHPKYLPSKAAIWKQILLPIGLTHKRPQVFHSPTSTLPILRPTKTVVTFCDLFHEANPDWTPPKVSKRLSSLYKFAARVSDKIIAISNNTKIDLVKYYDVDPDKITVIYPGKDEYFGVIDDKATIADVRTRYRIDKPFLLHVGALAEWRNVPRLIEAFSLLKTKNKIEHKLVLVGRDFWGFDLEGLTHTHGVSGEVISLPYVPIEDLRALYNAAESLVFPSLYEGFGIPVLEAMACGTPVVASNAAALPEAVGEAGILVDPYDVESIAGGVMQVISERPVREEMIKKGIEHAKQFSWDKMAQETILVYKEVVGK